MSLFEDILRRIDSLAVEVDALKVGEGSGAAGGAITGSGTTNRISQWTGASSLGDATLIKSGAGVLTLSAASAYTLTVSGTSAISGTLSGGGTVATGGYTLTVPATGTAALGGGIANHLALWSDANTLAASYALTSVGDLLYMANNGVAVQEVYFENSLSFWSYGAETVVATITLDRAPLVGETVQIVIDLYSGANNPVYLNTWRIRRTSLAGSVITSRDVYGSYSYNPHSDHWSATVTDATPGQTYVLTIVSASTLGGTGVGSDYRDIEINLITAVPIPASLPIGASGDLLTVSGGVPAWQSLTTIGLITGAGVANRDAYWTGTSTLSYKTYTAHGDILMGDGITPADPMLTEDQTDWIYADI